MAMQPEELLKRLTELLGEHQTQTEAKLSQLQITQSSGDAAEPAEAYIVKLAEELDKVVAARHVAGMYEDAECQPCLQTRQKITMAALERIEARVPGTREALALYEERNAPIEIVEE